MKTKMLLAATLSFGLGLSACNPALTPQQTIVAASSFDAAELAAANYIGLPRCPGATLCSDPAVVTKLIIAVRTARNARNTLEAAAQKGSAVSEYQAFTIAVNTLNNILVQNKIAGV